MSEAAAAALDRMQRKGYRAWVLTLLMLISLFGFADRQIIAVLGQPIKQDLGITDAQLGLVNGLFF
ncbi:MAG: hypothetical protein ACXU8Z_21300, partial [Caulobacteraceae bacterium]